MMEQNAINDTMIWGKVNCAPIRTLQIYLNRIFNVKETWLPTYYDLRTIVAVTCFPSTMDQHIWKYEQEWSLTDRCWILLTNGSATTTLPQFRKKVAVLANNCFLAYPSADIAWEHFSAIVEDATIQYDSVINLQWDWELQ